MTAAVAVNRGVKLAHSSPPHGFELADGTDPPLPYLSFLGVGAQLALQAGRQPLVGVVGHQAHLLHPPLDLRRHARPHRERESD